MSVFPATHIPVVSDYFSYMFRRHIFLLRINKSELTLFSKTFRLQLLPFLGLNLENKQVNKEIIE